jgi:hypothetical protein
MKKILLALLLVVALCGTSFATPDVTGNSNVITNTATATSSGGAGGAGGAGGSAVINDNSRTTFTNLNTNLNTNTNTNLNTNVQGQNQNQGQLQGQIQGQKQGQNNDQVIAPSQSINIETPRSLLAAPNTNGVELNYFSGGKRDVTSVFPKFVTKDVLPISSKDVIYRVFSVTANVKFKNLYNKAIDDMTKAIADKWPKERIRYSIVEFDAMKSWNTGGNMGGAGSALTGPTSGVSGAAGIIPSFGGSKVDPLYTITIIIVKY